MLAHPARMHHQRAAREPLLTVHHACAPRAMSVHANGAAVRMPLSGGGTSATRACQERPCPPLLALAWRARHHLGFHPANCLSLFENAKQTETAERKSIFISSRSTMAFQTLAQNSARQRHAESARTPLESMRSEPILRRIALMRLSDWFGPARIGADRTNPTRRRTDASVESLRAPPESVRTGPIRHGSDRFDAPD